MPVDNTKSSEQYKAVRARDNGHATSSNAPQVPGVFLRASVGGRGHRCAAAVPTPALTINKIKTTVSTVAGEQIANRSEISFRPRGGDGDASVATALSKVFKADLGREPAGLAAFGRVPGRHGLRPGVLRRPCELRQLDARRVVIDSLNPHDVVMDPDASAYDPAKWERGVHHRAGPRRTTSRCA